MSKPQSMLYQNTQYSRVMTLKYKSKLKKLKERIKDIVYENAALCDEVAQVQADLALARDERRFLIKRLMRHEGFESMEQQELEIEQQRIQQLQLQQLAKEQVAKEKETTPHVPKKRGPKKRKPEQTAAANTAKAESKSRNKARDKITLDAQGKPMFPINLYNILIHSAGEVLPANPNFHSEHWIYPVGYVATRMYAHPKDPKRKCVFTCKILNNAGNPQFQIIPDNDLDGVFFGDTANSCHQALLELLQLSLVDTVKLPMQVQGERFFGLSNPTVRTLIQLDPGFKQCANFKGFLQIDGVSGDNIAMFEDKDPTLCFEALQTLITVSAYHTMPEVKEEPPDELLNIS